MDTKKIITLEEDSSGIQFPTDIDPDEIVFVNIGPSHPAMHGTLRVLTALDGETIVAAVAEMGYLHRGFEKDCEIHPYQQCIPYTDRLNYLSAIMNNIGFAKAVEKMLGITIPERAKVIRVITAELNRIIDHLVCVGTNLVDIGALTNFWYSFNVREKVYDILEKLCGARLTSNYIRIGGLFRDTYPGFEEEVLHVCDEIIQAVGDIEKLTEKNRIFLDRTQNVAVISLEDAISYGWTGPTLRACGIDYDLRKVEPYYDYETYDFDVIVGTKGDNFDRIYVRLYEIRESIKIIKQALKRLEPGPIMTDDKRVALPPKIHTYGDIEGLMNHFKIIMHGIQPPLSEVYDCTESSNGELGFHIVSDGGKYPYRVKCRPPSFMNYAAFPELIEGGMIADAIATLGSINIIAGELDR
ncbi:MAG: NADH-quinone oxidoreductase subunit D [Candidatus Woesearchaeota archaeon]|nr:MAG: NADH-quinone oxidoreductase subunit D [Candidatus Woesearchaeota archaeon]GIX40453.1 MAG: NADH-quinone oxidoreductase subunit D [Leptospiraceae bacterium]